MSLFRDCPVRVRHRRFPLYLAVDTPATWKLVQAADDNYVFCFRGIVCAQGGLENDLQHLYMSQSFTIRLDWKMSYPQKFRTNNPFVRISLGKIEMQRIGFGQDGLCCRFDLLAVLIYAANNSLTASLASGELVDEMAFQSSADGATFIANRAVSRLWSKVTRERLISANSPFVEVCGRRILAVSDACDVSWHGYQTEQPSSRI